MKTAAHVLVALALALVTFGWWGTETIAGRQRFDEMAGMIPFAARVAGWLCLLVAALLYLLVWRRR